ncbi:MAG: hypothetical protein ACO3A4_07190 [Silvanigrellaceae bacterium]
MKFWFGLIAATLLCFGCKKSTEADSSLASAPANTADRRIMSKGVMRLKTNYTRDGSQFNSTCSAVLIHTPEPSLNYCVALTAAHCFRHIPDNAQHSLEIIDGKGEVVKSHRVADVTTHPGFTATDAVQTLEQAANDVALLEFKCALPEAIQPARVLDISALNDDPKLFTTQFVQVKKEEKSQPLDALVDSLLGHEPLTTFPIYLLQRSAELLSIDFPTGIAGQPSSHPVGVLNLSIPTEPDVCSGDAGAPLFAQYGQEIFLVASASSGTGYCNKENLLYPITSGHAQWINKTLELQVVVPTTKPNPGVTIEARSRNSSFTESRTQEFAAGPVQEFKTPTTQGKLRETEIRPGAAPTALPGEQSVEIIAPSKVTTTPVPVLTVPMTLPTIKPQIAKPAVRKAKEIPTPAATVPTPRPTVAPIPPPPATEEVEEVCMGVRLKSNSKSAVWGTVLKLVDKDSTQIPDESLKCEFANENELCVVAKPIPTGTGNSRVVLSQSLNQAGCSKFYSGRTIYILPDDFQVNP